MKTKYKILYFFIIIAIILLQFVVSQCNANLIQNKTDYQIDTLIKNVLDILQVKDVIVIIKNVPNLYTENYKDIYALTFEQHDNKVYIIYLSEKCMYLNVNDIIIHELIHVQQYYKDRLIQIDNKTVKFRNDIYNLFQDDYDTRLFEIEAIQLVKHIKQLIKKIY